MADLDREREPLVIQVNTAHSGDFMGFEEKLSQEATDVEIEQVCHELQEFLKEA